MADPGSDAGGGPVAIAGGPPSRSDARRRRAHVARAVEVIGLTAGTVLVLGLLWQWLDVYLTFSAEPAEALPGHGERYVATVTACLTSLAVASLAAVLARHRRVVALGVVLLLVAVSAASVFVVPRDRWARESVVDTGPRVPPCLSGGDSDECVGG